MMNRRRFVPYFVATLGASLSVLTFAHFGRWGESHRFRRDQVPLSTAPVANAVNRATQTTSTPAPTATAVPVRRDPRSKPQKLSDELSLACWSRDVKEILRLLQAGARINGISSTGVRPLCQAVEMSSHASVASGQPDGHDPRSADVVKLLLARGADPNLANRDMDAKAPGVPTTSPLELALGAAHECSPQPAIVRALLRAGANPNAQFSYSSEWFRGEGTPLSSAAIWGDTVILRMLLGAGAHVNGRDSRGRTALMHSARSVGIWNRRHPGSDTMRLLLRRGANVRARDDKGWTALFYAIAEERRDYQGLYQLSGVANFEAVKRLLRHGAQINTRDRSGRTPLMWAAFYRTDSSYSNSSTQLLDQDAMVRLLLRSGANPRLRDKAGQTARDLAIRANNLHVVRALDKFKLPTKRGR